MLSRPEIGTKEHILLWLASKDPQLEYSWRCPHGCAAATYCVENYDWAYHWIDSDDLQEVSRKACPRPHTYGSLYQRMQKVWT